QPSGGRDAALILDESILAHAEKQARRAMLSLASLQERDGYFRLGKAENPAPIAVAALSTLAMMSLGEVPGRTPAGRNVEAGIRYLLDNQDLEKSSKSYGYIADGRDLYSKMHGHGYATMALAEAYGMLTPHRDAPVTHRELKLALEAAVSCIERSQGETGGWYYDPTPISHEGSITICLVQALRAARNAGIAVDAAVVRKAVGYVERSQKPDGSFRYMLGDNRSSIALTAAAVATLEAAGQFDNPSLVKGRSYLLRHRSSPRGLGSGSYPYYRKLYLAQALFFARDLSAFRRWYTLAVSECEATRKPDSGRWSSHRYGEAYATAMNILVLAMPLQYLPIHQR
ncbi:MAG: prenyltransferase/squalene oxidase repeat-containing protein, partial [Planctomycetota bacterium]